MKKLIALILAALLLLSTSLAQAVVMVGFGQSAAPAGISDDFSTAEDPATTNYTAVKGAILISGGTLGGKTAWQNNYSYHKTSTGSANNYAQGKIQTGGTIPAGGAIGVRSDGTTGYLVCLNADASRITLSSFNSTTLTANPEGQTYKTITGGSAGSWLVRLEISGTTISPFIDLNGDGDFGDTNETLATWTVTAITAGNYVTVGAFRGADNGDYRVDNFSGGAL